MEKIVIKFILSFFIALLILFFLRYLLEYIYSNPSITISKKINQANINLLKLNMLETDAIQILGEPFYRRKNQFSENNSTNYYLEYSKLGLLDTGVEIYLAIKNNKLIGIYMEYFDIRFYQCTKDKCPNIIDKELYDRFIPDQAI